MLIYFKVRKLVDIENRVCARTLDTLISILYYRELDNKQKLATDEHRPGVLGPCVIITSD